MDNDKLFTIDEVVKYLGIPKSTIYKLSQKGNLPSCKIGKQLRFRKSSLDQWMSEKEGTAETLSPIIANTPDKAVQKKAHHILLIDDDKLVLRAITKFLVSTGYNVESANSAEEALQKIKDLKLDLVITDVKMPGVDGIETIKKIRAFYKNSDKPSIPEIIITGYMDADAEKEAKELGIKDYVYKPFAINDFIKVIEKRLKPS